MSWKRLLAETPSDFQLRTREHFRILREIASVTYNLAGLVVASRRTVRCSPSGFRAAEIRMLVSRRAGRDHPSFGFACEWL